MDTDLEREFIGLMQEMGEISGMDRSTAAMMAHIYLEPSDLPLEEIARRTGCSLSSASTKINMLEKMGLVSKGRKPSSHKVFVHMEKDFSKLIREQVMERHRKKFRLARKRLPAMIQKYRKTPASRRNGEKLLIIENYYKNILRLESAIERMIDALSD